MKKFYETPAVEFTGFAVEDVITTSTVNTREWGADQEAALKARVAADDVVYGKTTTVVDYDSYTW